jgi:hypothetical protein
MQPGCPGKPARMKKIKARIFQLVLQRAARDGAAHRP